MFDVTPAVAASQCCVDQVSEVAEVLGSGVGSSYIWNPLGIALNSRKRALPSPGLLLNSHAFQVLQSRWQNHERLQKTISNASGESMSSGLALAKDVYGVLIVGMVFSEGRSARALARQQVQVQTTHCTIPIGWLHLDHLVVTDST